MKAFHTNVISEALVFQVSPKKGIPFDTPFELTVNKQGARSKLKCEFGYENRLGKVIIPTVDTGDYLKQSKGKVSAKEFNMDTVKATVKFPPLAQTDKSSDNLTIFV